jgi:hypothetical protein
MTSCWCDESRGSPTEAAARDEIPISGWSPRISEILPEGDKQLMQGLLNQRDQLDQAKARLF